MAAPAPLPAASLTAADFLGSIEPEDLVYFLCNVGDGDAQLVLLPDFGGATERRAIVVDAGRTKKIPRLLDDLQHLLAPQDPIALVVATHPHSDHIRGMKELLKKHGDGIAEFWDPGYYHTSADYLEMMAEIEQRGRIVYAQPTSGLRRWIGNVAVTVLSPSVQLRNRFDTYGTEINDSSISLRIEFPASRVVQRNERRELIPTGKSTALVLGADAQTLSWAFVVTDFPRLHRSHSAAAEAIAAATGADLLAGYVLKVSHHASKHGINLELVERIKPSFTLVSSQAGAGSYNFPHSIAQELIREALEPTTSSGAAHKADHELGIFYTSDTDDAGTSLGSIGIVVPLNGPKRMWRFGDSPDHRMDLSAGRRWSPP